MGRGQYYRWNKKSTTDDYDPLDMQKFAGSVDLTRPRWGGWQWTRGERKSSITYIVEPGCGVRLRYSSSGKEYDYLVCVVTTTPNYGGKRHWWICPNIHCGRRCRILYGGHIFACRQCQDLTYATTQSGGALTETIDNRLLFLHHKLKGEGHYLYDLPAKPKWMHWRTYSGYAREYLNLHQMREQAFVSGALALMGGLTLDDGTHLNAKDAVDDFQASWQAHKANPAHPARLEPRHTDQHDWMGNEADRDGNRLTLGELASLANLPYEFAQEAQRAGLINADQGRGQRRKRYRERLKNWLRKLHALRAAGLAWAEIQDWTRRRFKPGHEHERIWPGGVTLLPQGSVDHT